MGELRVTITVARLLREFMLDVSCPRYGYDLMASTGFSSGRLYPNIQRLKRAGFLDEEIEAIDPQVAGRPPRKMYKLNAKGIAFAERELSTLSQQISIEAPRRAAGSRVVGEG